MNSHDAHGPATQDGRLASVQALRAVGALLVVWVHSIDAAQYSFAFPRQIHFFYWENFGACGVDIFFAISGFIVSLVAARAAGHKEGHTYSAARTFLTRRITRIFPLYWALTILLIFLLEMGHHKIVWGGVQWTPTLLLLPSLRYPAGAPLLALGWSLVFEFYFYLVLAAFLLWTPRFVVRNAAVFLCGMVALGAVIGFRRPLFVLWANPMVLEFVFGCLIGLLYLRQKNGGAPHTALGRWAALLGAFLLAATIFTGYGNASEQDWILAGRDCWLRVGLWGTPAALLVGGVIFWAPSMRSFPARLLVFLGDASYSIYLCTIPARSLVVHEWKFFGWPGADMGVLFGALFCTLVGVICYLVIERPLMRFFHNWYKPVPFRLAHI